MNILPLPAFTDNYIWLIEENGKATVVDPGDAKVVDSYLKENGLKLENILITHHHYDHTGGVEQLKESYECNVYGPCDSPFKGVEIKLKENDEITIHGCSFKIIEVPGHTLDHIAYYSAEQDVLFCGDTLFAGGCGRVFEGTFEQMFKSLKKISNYPKETKIFCGHEYTLSNLKFALEVDEDNKQLEDEYINVKKLISSDMPSLPTNLNKELNVNPFLRCNEINIKNKVIDKFDIIDDELEVFTALRKWKDNF